MAADCLSREGVINNAMGADRDIDKVTLQHAGLRAWFYDGKPCPPRGRKRERVLLVTGMHSEGRASVDLDQDEEEAADRVTWSALRAAVGYPHEAALTT